MYKFLKKEWQVIVVAIIVAIYGFVGIKYLWDMDHRTVRYDCSISEISPDFPPQVKEQCRKLRASSGRI